MDLHGHSRKHNVFTYGCGSNKGDHDQFLNERIFPFLLSRQVLCSITLKFHMIFFFWLYVTASQYVLFEELQVLCSTL